MSMSTSTQSVGEEIRVLEVTLELGNKLQKLKQDEASISKKIKGLESQLKSARNIDLETCQKKLASLQEVSDTFGDDDDDAEVLEVTKLLIPKYIKYISLKKSVPDMQAKRQDLVTQLKVVRDELALAEKVDVNAASRWLEAHRSLLNTYAEPTPKNVEVSDISKKRALQAALAAENRRVKCAQGRIKALRMSLDALNGAENAGASFLVRNFDDGDEDFDEEEVYGSPTRRSGDRDSKHAANVAFGSPSGSLGHRGSGSNDDDDDDEGDQGAAASGSRGPDFRKASPAGQDGGDAGEAGKNNNNHQTGGSATVSPEDLAARKKARAFWRKHTLEDDPIFLAKQKLKAAAYGYKNDWGGLYAAIDRDGSGSLDQEEFRLGLRTRARIPQSQLTDQELRKLFSAIDYTNDGSVQAQEFVDFMGLNAKDYEADDAAAAAAVAEAASYRPVVARLRDFYRQKRPDKLAVGLTAIHAHEDREMELVHKLVNRYGAEARTFFVQFLPANEVDSRSNAAGSGASPSSASPVRSDLSFEAVDLNGDGVIDPDEFSEMMGKRREGEGESPQVVDIVATCVKDLSAKLASCESHLAKIRVLTEDDVDYLMSEMNAALEPAFAVLPQDHEIMLKCFEFVSRVDDLFSSGKGGMDDDSESRFELTQEAGNDGGGDDEEVIDMDALEPMESPTFQQVEQRSLEIETADPAMSDSVAALARASQVSPKARGLALAASTISQKLQESRSARENSAGSDNDDGDDIANGKSLAEAIDDAISSVSESEEDEVSTVKNNDDDDDDDSEAAAQELEEMERRFREEHGSPTAAAAELAARGEATPPPPPQNPKPFSRGEVQIGASDTEQDDTEGEATEVEGSDDDAAVDDDVQGSPARGDEEPEGDTDDDTGTVSPRPPARSPKSDSDVAQLADDLISAAISASQEDGENDDDDDDDEAEFDSWDPFKNEEATAGADSTAAPTPPKKGKKKKRRKKKK